MAQEITAENSVGTKAKEGFVRGQDMVTVYATAKALFVKEGEAMNVHQLLAEKLIASGKATDSSKAKK